MVTKRVRKNFLPYRLVRPTSQARGKAMSTPRNMEQVAVTTVLRRAVQFMG